MMKPLQCSISSTQSVFQEYFTGCYHYQLLIQRLGTVLPPYLTGMLPITSLPSIDATFQRHMQASTSPKTSTMSIATKCSTAPATSLTSSTSLAPRTSTRSSSLLPSSSSSSAAPASTSSPSSLSSSKTTKTLIESKLPTPKTSVATVSATCMTSAAACITSAASCLTSAPCMTSAAACITSAAACTTSAAPCITSAAPCMTSAAPCMTSAAAPCMTSAAAPCMTSAAAPCMTSNTANQLASLKDSSKTLPVLTTTKPPVTATTINQSTLSWLSHLLVLLLMSIPSVVSFPTQRIRPLTDDSVSSHSKQHTPSMTIKLSFLDHRLNETTTAETKRDVPLNYTLPQVDTGQHFSSPISVRLNNLLGNPSTYNPLFDSTDTDSSQFVTESDNETIVWGLKPTSSPPNQSVNLAVIPVLGIFFLMVILWTKCSTWFRDHLRDQDHEDDGKEYVILNPPEDGYREVEFRSDTSSMYYDTVSSYRSILRQKVEYGGFNNYDTVTSIRSILQRADVRDAAVQVKLQGEHLKTDRWKSVSGILNNSGSSSDLLRVPKKTHRQVSFQTSQNESYDPPLQQTCDANIQVGDSSTERMKNGEKNKTQNRLQQKPVETSLDNDVVEAKYYGSETQLSMESSRTSLIGLDDFDVPYPSASHQADNTIVNQQQKSDSGGCAEGSGGEGSLYSGVSSVTSKDEPAQCEIIHPPKNRRVHQFQVLRVDSSDGIYREPLQSNDSEMASETTDVSDKDTSLPATETSQDDYSMAQSLSHPHHYLCRRLRQAKRRSKDPTAPISDSISDFKPPIFSEVKFGQPPSDEDECDYIDDINVQVKHSKQRDSMFSEKLFIEENDEDSCWCEQSIDSGEDDKLIQLLEAHASSVAGAPRASPISMNSSASSTTLSSHSSCSSLEAIKDEINEDCGGEEIRGMNPPHEGSSCIDQHMYAEEETPLIMDLAGDSPCQSPEIHALARQRGHRSSSGYDTQGHETPSTAKGHMPETGDTSCDVTPLTSSSNSLQECCDGKRHGILVEAHSAQQPISSHLPHQSLPHPRHHHPPLPHQQQHDQLLDTSTINPEFPQDAARIPSYIPHYTYHLETRPEDNNNNNNNNNNDSLRRTVMERNRYFEQRFSLASPSATGSNTTNDNNPTNVSANRSRSSSNSSTAGGSIRSGINNNNNNNNNTSESKKDSHSDAESDDVRLMAAKSGDIDEESMTDKGCETTEQKTFHRKPVPPILYEKAPFLLPSNHIKPSTPSTADVHLPATKKDCNIEIV